MVVLSLLLVEEARVHERTPFREYATAAWELMCSKAFFCVLLWQLLNPSIQYVHSTAYPPVQRFWAGVQTLPNQASSIVAYGFFSASLWVVREHFLGVSWRAMIGVTTMVLLALDAPFALLTTYDVVRNQYFYLGENLVTYIPGAVFLVVSCFVLVEHATEAHGGLVYGLLSAANYVGQSIPNAISNQLFGMFYPALSHTANYNPKQGGDQQCFRNVVASSFLLGYGFATASLLTLPLMPNQKADARRRLATWPRHNSYAVSTVVLVVVSLGYSVTTNVLALTPLACLRVAGGQGCSGVPHADPEVAQPCDENQTALV